MNLAGNNSAKTTRALTSRGSSPRRSIAKTVPRSRALRPGAKIKEVSSSTSKSEKVAEWKLTENRKSLGSIPSIPNINSEPETCAKVPANPHDKPQLAEYMNSLVEPLFHLFNSVSASSDEMMFLGVAEQCGFYRAKFIAAEFEWNIERPLSILRLLKVAY
jgi:hypothetical protein